MEKKKLKLDDLKVESFVTNLDTEDNQTAALKGGDHWTRNDCSVTRSYNFFHKKCDIPTVNDGGWCFDW